MLRHIIFFTLILPIKTEAQQTDTVRVGDTTIITNQATGESEVFTLVDKIPKPSYDVQEYISSNLVYPEKAKEDFMFGKVIVKFIVRANGSIDSPIVVKGVAEDLDSEAIRIVKSMPEWSPGEKDGNKVDVYFSLPITFLHSDTIYTFTEKMPDPGYNVNQFIMQNLRYPEEAMKKGIQGRVAVKFVVTSTGHIKGVSVAGRLQQPLLDEEAIRIVSSMPPWQPGTQNGKPVNIYYTLPVTFQL